MSSVVPTVEGNDQFIFDAYLDTNGCLRAFSVSENDIEGRRLHLQLTEHPVKTTNNSMYYFSSVFDMNSNEDENRVLNLLENRFGKRPAIRTAREHPQGQVRKVIFIDRENAKSMPSASPPSVRLEKSHYLLKELKDLNVTIFSWQRAHEKSPWKNPRVLAIDLVEIAGRIFAIDACFENAREAFNVKAEGDLNEHMLLREFFSYVDRKDPDVIVCKDSQMFVTLVERSQALGVVSSFALGRATAETPPVITRESPITRKPFVSVRGRVLFSLDVCNCIFPDVSCAGDCQMLLRDFVQLERFKELTSFLKECGSMVSFNDLMMFGFRVLFQSVAVRYVKNDLASTLLSSLNWESGEQMIGLIEANIVDNDDVRKAMKWLKRLAPYIERDQTFQSGSNSQGLLKILPANTNEFQTSVRRPNRETSDQAVRFLASLDPSENVSLSMCAALLLHVPDDDENSEKLNAILLGKLVQGSVFQLSSLEAECRKRGLICSERFVRFLLTNWSRIDALLCSSDRSKILFQNCWLFRQAQLLRDQQELKSMTADKLVKRITRHPMTPSDEQLRGFFLQWATSLSSTGPWDFLGDGTCFGLFQSAFRLMDDGQVTQVFRDCVSDDSRAGLLRAMVLEKVSLQELVISDSSRRLVGRSFEPLLRENPSRARMVFEVLEQTSFDSKVDIYELTTPVRHRSRVESWRRLGETYRAEFLLTMSWNDLSQDPIFVQIVRNVNFYELWASALRGEVAINTVAACLGCLVQRSATLSDFALSIHTQPDDEGLIPLAFITSFMKNLSSIFRDDASDMKGAHYDSLLAFAYCSGISKAFLPRYMSAVPKEFVQTFASNSPSMMAGDLPFPLQLAALLFRNRRESMSLLRSVLTSRCVINPLNDDTLGCFWCCEVMKLPLSSNLPLPSDLPLAEELLALSHLRTWLPSGGCICCSAGTTTGSQSTSSAPCHYIFDVYWKLYLICTRSDAALMGLAHCLEYPKASSPIRMQLNTSGVVPRFQLLAKSACEQLLMVLKVENKQEWAKRVNPLLRVLGSICFSHPSGRRAVIEHLPWNVILSTLAIVGVHLLPESVRTNLFVLLHEIITNVTNQQQPLASSGKVTSMQQQQGGSYFTTKRDDFLLVEVDTKNSLCESLLRVGLCTMPSAKIGSLTLECCAQLIDNYRGKIGLEEKKKSCAELATHEVFLAVQRQSEVFQNERFRQGVAKLLQVMVQACPLLHQLSVLKNDPSSLGVARKSAALQCARYAEKSVGDKIVAAIQ